MPNKCICTHSYNWFQHSAYIFHFSVHKCTQTFLLHKLDWTLYSTFSNISMLSVWVYSGFTSISVSVMPCYHIKSMSVTVSDYNKISVLQSVALALKFHLHFIGIWIQQRSTVQNLEPAVWNWKFLKRCSWKKKQN